MAKQINLGQRRVVDPTRTRLSDGAYEAVVVAFDDEHKSEKGNISYKISVQVAAGEHTGEGADIYIGQGGATAKAQEFNADKLYTFLLSTGCPPAMASAPMMLGAETVVGKKCYFFVTTKVDDKGKPNDDKSFMTKEQKDKYDAGAASRAATAPTTPSPFAGAVAAAGSVGGVPQPANMQAILANLGNIGQPAAPAAGNSAAAPATAAAAKW